MADVQIVTVTLSDGTPVQVVAGTPLHELYLALAGFTTTSGGGPSDIDLRTVRTMAWFMTPHGPQSVIEPATITEFRRRDYAEITAQQAADFFAGAAEIPDVSFITGQELPAAMAAAAADTSSPFAVAQRVALVPVAAIRNDFSNDANGTPTVTDSGQTWDLHGHPMVVSGGLLTDTASTVGQSGGYAQIDAGATVTRPGAEFSWASATNPGTVAVLVWRTPFGADADIPASPCHFTIWPTGWGYGIWPSKGAAGQEVLAFGSFATPLATDGTRHTVEIVMDGDTASVLLPDGSSARVTDPRIASLAGRYACWETYYSDASTQAKPGFRRIWASAEPPAAYAGAAVARIARAGQLIRRRARYITSVSGESRAATTTFPAPELDTGLRLSAVVPPSGRLWQTLTAFVYGSGEYVWSISAWVDGAQISNQDTIVADGTYTAGLWVNLPLMWEGLTPGTLVEFRWAHRATVTGPNIYLAAATGRRATVTVEPLAA